MQQTQGDMDVADCVKGYLDQRCRYEGDEDRVYLLEEMRDNNITSPPEQLFYIAWTLHPCQTIGLMPQRQVGKYFVDFAVSILDHFVNELPRHPFELLEKINDLVPHYAIEIDGFEWHDKTREQAEADKKRERYIQSQGYIVLRFAAREVIRDPDSCVNEVRDRLRQDIAALQSTHAITSQGEPCLI